jgi:predicted nuclease of predicted toxin-antitoxin system
MRFVIDVNLSPMVGAILRSRGHECTHLFERGLERLEDHEVLETVREEGAILLTSDLDFGYLMAKGHAALPSIVLFRLPDMTPGRVSEQLLSVIELHAADLAAGAFVVVTEASVRVRRLPMGEHSE